LTNTNKDQVVREAFRLAELNLQTQFNLMIAADQRATTFSGILIAAVAVVATMYDKDTSHWNDDLSLLLLALAASLSVFAARSVRIFAPGLKFGNFSTDISSSREYLTVLSELGKQFDECAEKNRATIRRNAKLYNISLAIAVVGFLASLAPSIGSLLERVQAIACMLGDQP
jgi:hypothetical protein